MATTPPGWYDDERGALRWWDGAQWTEHVQEPDPESAVDEAAPASEPPTAEAADSSTEPLGDDTVPAPGDVPPGYPGGFPGGVSPSGAFISATEPRKSKLWIVWVVIGVVLLGIVILATVLIPIVIGMFGSTSGSGTGNADDEAAAVAAVKLYDEAWGTTDCDKFERATTEDFRAVLQLTDCASFTAASQGFIDSVEDYQLTVTSVESDAAQITVSTSETYSSIYDRDGNPTETPVDYEDFYAYIVISSGDGWAINDAIGN